MMDNTHPVEADLKYCLYLPLLLTACWSTTDQHGVSRSTTAVGPQSRDSAGITIYTHSADALDRAPLVSIDSTPLVTYAGTEDDEAADVTALRYLAFLPGGDLVGFDLTRHAVVQLGPDPKERRTLGREGEGPGDFGRVAALVVAPDGRILVDDVSNRRIATVGPGLASMSTTLTPAIPGMFGSWLVGMTSTGVVLAAQGCAGVCSQGGQGSGIYQPDVTASSGRMADSALTTRFKFPGRPYQMTVLEIDGGQAFTGQPLHFTTQPRLRLWHDQFAVIRGDEWILVRRDTLGNVTSRIEIPTPTAAVTDADWQSLRTHLVQEAIDEAAEFGHDLSVADAEKRIDEQARHNRIPRLGNLLISPNGVAWMVDYQTSGRDGWAATAVDTAGRILGRLMSPVGDPPVAFGTGRIALRTTDDLGIATIAVHRLKGLID